ncbi:MAG TPA: PIN domain-containing protein [Desulfuromonadales bacterium]|nr:PIN domain-containing protein [Desulfuromonadales bacterium]
MKGVNTFLDTNILIYAYDTSAGDKHQKARDLLTGLWESGLGMVSTQVLQEFHVTVTRKIPKPLDLATAREIITDFLTWDVVVNDGDAILKAIDVQEKHGFSFWDSMVIAAAITGGAAVLLTEDLSDGQKICGVEIRNPFAGRVS